MHMKFSKAICIYGNSSDLSDSSIISTLRAEYDVFGHLIGKNINNINNFVYSDSIELPKTHRLGDLIDNQQFVYAEKLRHIDLSFSLMNSIRLKSNFELENNFQYNVIIICKPQIIHNLLSMLDYIMVPDPYCISTNVKRNRSDNGLWSIDENIIVASSNDANTLSRFYFPYRAGEFWSFVSSCSLDPAWNCAEFGTLLYKWATLKNLHINSIS